MRSVSFAVLAGIGGLIAVFHAGRISEPTTAPTPLPAVRDPAPAPAIEPIAPLVTLKVTPLAVVSPPRPTLTFDVQRPPADDPGAPPPARIFSPERQPPEELGQIFVVQKEPTGSDSPLMRVTFRPAFTPIADNETPIRSNQVDRADVREMPAPAIVHADLTFPVGNIDSGN